MNRLEDISYFEKSTDAILLQECLDRRPSEDIDFVEALCKMQREAGKDFLLSGSDEAIYRGLRLK